MNRTGEIMDTDIGSSSQIALILGMHRSGTSLLAEMIHGMGYDMAEDILADIPEVNPDGFFEDARIVSLNDQALVAAGRNWMDIRQVSTGQSAPGEAGTAWEKSAMEYLAQSYAGRSRSLIKDPRLCRLMAMWRPLLAEMKFSVKFLVVLRHPLEVARSLARRDGISQAYAVALWCVHYMELFREIASDDFLVLNYHELLADPHNALAQLSDYLSVSKASYDADIVAGLARKIQRPDVAREDIPQQLMSIAEEIHGAASLGSRGLMERQADLEQRWKAAILSSQMLTDLLISSQDKLQQFSAKAVEIGEKHGRALQVIRQREEQIREQQGQLEAIGDKHREALDVIDVRDGQLAELNKSLEELGVMHRQALDTIETRDDQLEELNGSLKELGSMHRKALDTIEERDEQLEQSEARLEEAKEQYCLPRIRSFFRRLLRLMRSIYQRWTREKS